MKTTHIPSALFIAIATAIVLIGCGSGNGEAPAGAREPQESPAPTEASGQDGGQEVAESPFTPDGILEIRMEMRGSRNVNDPIGVQVEPGTTVRFINVSGMHSATAYHQDNGRDNRIPPGAESWNSGLLSRRNETFEVTLTAEGVYDYFCIPHETTGHAGRIVVGNPEAYPAQPTDGLPAAVVDALPSVDQIMADGIVRP